jgi:hypothetical protein
LTKQEKALVDAGTLKPISLTTSEEKQTAFYELAKDYAENIAPKLADIESQKAATLGRSVEYLKSQLDIYNQITKAAIDFKTIAEFNLDIQKESVLSSSKEKEEATLRLQLLQKDREVRIQQLDVVNQLSNQKIDKFTTGQPGGLSESKFAEIKAGFSGIEDSVKRGASAKDIAAQYKEVLNSAGITNDKIINEQTQLIQERLDNVKNLGNLSKQQLIIDDSKLQLIKSINFNYNSTKEKLEAQVSLQKQKISLLKQEKDIQLDISDSEFKRSILALTPDQQESLSARRQPQVDFQRAETNRVQKANEATDKIEKDRVEKVNQADALIFQSEKQLKEYGEKLSESNKTAIESALSELKIAHASQDLTSIDSGIEKLNTAWTGASQEMYANTQEGGDQPQQNTETPSDDSAEDVAFEEVK